MEREVSVFGESQTFNGNLRLIYLMPEIIDAIQNNS